MSAERRRYRMLPDEAKQDAVATAISRIEAGDSFTAACGAVAAQLDVSETAVRGWVNASGLRPRPSWEVVQRLQRELAVANELTRRLQARTVRSIQGTGSNR